MQGELTPSLHSSGRSEAAVKGFGEELHLLTSISVFHHLFRSSVGASSANSHLATATNIFNELQPLTQCANIRPNRPISSKNCHKIITSNLTEI
jgi:hypothetical protein